MLNGGGNPFLHPVAGKINVNAATFLHKHRKPTPHSFAERERSSRSPAKGWEWKAVKTQPLLFNCSFLFHVWSSSGILVERKKCETFAVFPPPLHWLPASIQEFLLSASCLSLYQVFLSLVGRKSAKSSQTRVVQARSNGARLKSAESFEDFTQVRSQTKKICLRALFWRAIKHLEREENGRCHPRLP